MGEHFEIKQNQEDQIENRERSEFDEEYAKKIFISSFRFSQGEPLLQQDIFAYLHGIRPSWRIDAKMKRRLLTSSLGVIRKIVPTRETIDTVKFPHPVVNEEKQVSLQGETRNRLNDMQDALKSVMIPNAALLVAKITEKMIAKDIKFLKQDRPLSYICQYGIRGHSTGIEEYDMLFKEINAYIFETLKYVESPLYELIDLYNARNPDNKIIIWGAN